MRRNIVLGIIGLILGLGLVAVMFLMRPYQMRGSVIEQDYAAPDFALADAQASIFQLSDQRGKLVMIFFGYTYCPDVCPTTLSELKQVRKRLGSRADDVQVVFISVDPERDTPEQTANYAARFDPTFKGLSGSEAALDPVWKAYGVYHKTNKASPDDKYYEVEHSGQVYVIDKAGNLRVTYAFGTPVDDILQDAKYLLKQ